MEEITETHSHKKIIIILCFLLIFIVGIICYSRFVGTTGLYIKDYKVENKNLPASFYGFKIVHFSDIHYGRTIHKNELMEVVKKINLLKPDIVVFTGDLFDKEEVLDSKDYKEITEILISIQANIGKFAITGEHDTEVKEWSTIMKNSGFINLNDTHELIYQNGLEPILIAGLSSNLKSTKSAKDKISATNGYIESLNNKKESKVSYKILLMHEPDFIKDITYDNYDLILAGHSHNGQIRLPFIGAIIKPEGAKTYYDEYYKLKKTDFFISSGLGTTKFDFRLLNRPSISIYRLVNK